MTQHDKSPLTMSVPHRDWVQFLAVPLLLQLPTNVLGKAMEEAQVLGTLPPHGRP